MGDISGLMVFVVACLFVAVVMPRKSALGKFLSNVLMLLTLVGAVLMLVAAATSGL